MKKLVSGLILMAVLLAACSSPSAPVVKTGTDIPVTGNQTPTIFETTPPVPATNKPETITSETTDRENYADLAVNQVYIDTLESLSGLSFDDLRMDSVAYSPDGRFVAFGGCTGLSSGHCQTGNLGSDVSFLYILDAKTAKLVSTLPETTATITGLSFSNDGTKLVYTTSPAKVAVWDVASGSIEKVFWQMKDNSSFGNVAFSPNSDLIALVYGQSLFVWNYPSGDLLAQVPAVRATPIFPKFSSDGKKLAVFTRDYGKAMAIYDTGTWKRLSEFNLPVDQVVTSAISNDGNILATVDDIQNSDILLWDTQTGVQIGVLGDPLVYVDAMNFTPDGSLLITSGVPADSSNGETYGVWDVPDRKYLGGWMSERSVRRIIFSADGKTFFADARLWGAPDENVLAARQILKDYLQALNKGDYDTAAGLFMMVEGASSYYGQKGLDVSSLPTFLKSVCAAPGDRCMPVKSIRYGGGKSIGEGYLFYVQFQNPDGSLFVDSYGFSSTAMFLSRDTDGKYKVTGLPPIDL